MHAAGRNGTNGQMKPGRGKKSKHIILLDLPIAYCLHIGIYFKFLIQLHIGYNIYSSCPDNNSQNGVFKPFIPLPKFF